jgi:hypothetical protein
MLGMPSSKDSFQTKKRDGKFMGRLHCKRVPGRVHQSKGRCLSLFI